MYDGTITQPNNSSQGPTYSATTNNNNVYDVIDCSQQKISTPRPRLPNLTPQRNEASKKEDDFHNAEPHTYSVVNPKKKANKQPTTVDNGEKPPAYDSARVKGESPGESGVGQPVY